LFKYLRRESDYLAVLYLCN